MYTYSIHVFNPCSVYFECKFPSTFASNTELVDL